MGLFTRCWPCIARVCRKRLFVCSSLTLGTPWPILFIAMGRNWIDFSFLPSKSTVATTLSQVDRFVQHNFCGRRLKDEVAQIVENRPVAINFHAVQQGRSMHHDDVRAGIHLVMRPFLQPVGRGEALRQLLLKQRDEGLVEDMVVFINHHVVGVLSRLANILKNALRVCCIGLVALDPKFIHTGSVCCR